jgi:drug/metabolite transporter (DMT)-like permease
MPPSPSERVHPLVAALCISVLCLVWGSTWLVIRIGLEDLPPLTSATVRFVVAASAMSLAALVLGRAEGGDRAPLWLTAVVGTTQFFASYSIVYWSETILPSSMVAVLFATFPLMMAFAGHRFLGERLRPVQAAGFALGFVGVVTLFATDLQTGGPRALFAGAVLLLSPTVSTIGTVVLKKHGAGYSSLRLNRDAMAIGALLLALAAIVFERPAVVGTAAALLGRPSADSGIAWTPTAMLSVAYLALAGTCLTFGLYFWLMRRMSASKLSLIAFANPCIAVLLGSLVGERITAWTLIGSGLVVAGVALVVVRRSAFRPWRRPASATSEVGARG